MALKENKLEHFYRIICTFGCTNFIEVVEDVEDVAPGTISLDIHYKREYGFENYFLSRTPKTNSDTQFIKFWEKVFNCKVNDGNMSTINGSGLPQCAGDEKVEEGTPNPCVHCHRCSVLNCLRTKGGFTKCLPQRTEMDGQFY